ISTKHLNFIGERAHGVFILLTQPGRKWIFSNKESAIYPIEIELKNRNKIILNSNELNCYLA
ncbi:hypothetical protein ACOI1D_19115, partial [Virgibacillus sp. DJP39]